MRGVEATGPGRLPFAVSEETTAITGPLRADGTVDYVAALNERLRQGVTPENNGFVKFLEVMGTGDNVMGSKIKLEFLTQCGAKEVGAGVKVWEEYAEYLNRTKGPADADFDRLWQAYHAAAREPWRAQEHPELATFLLEQEGLLETAAAALERAQWWPPKVSYDGRTLVAVMYPMVGRCRDVIHASCVRAMLRGTTGQFEGCLGDIRTARQLGRRYGIAPTPIERLLAATCETSAAQALAGVAADGMLAEAQCRAAMNALDELPALPSMAEAFDITVRWELLDQLQWLALGHVKLIAAGCSAEADTAAMLRAIEREQVDWNAVLKTFNRMTDDMVKVMGEADITRVKAGAAAIYHAAGVPDQPDDVALARVGRQARETRAGYTERVVTMLTPQFFANGSAAEEVYRRSGQYREMARVVLAAAHEKARTGQWPERQEELVPAVLPELPKDMHSKGGAAPFRYEVRAEGVRVSSVGQNGRLAVGAW
jgi:hypothetical protein